MVVLAIGAHPDDVEFGCFGTLARFSRDSKIHIIILTSGEIGGPKKIRINEARESAKLLKAELTFLNYPDGNIPVNGEIVSNLNRYVKELSPQTVFTLYPNDTHQDHRNTSKITVSSCRFVKEILFYEVDTTEKDFKPNVFYDITDYFTLKEKALLFHKTQRSKPPFQNLEAIKGLASFRAFQCGYKALFEAFCLYKDVRR